MYKYMDDVEIDISSIKNLKLIHFYHVNKNDEVLEAALVHYDTDKIINLCVLDKHYDDFLAKLFMVYEEERKLNRIASDSYSRSILEKAVLSDTHYYEEYMEGLKEIKKPAYYHPSYMPYITIPVMKYVLTVLYELSDKELVWSELSDSWFGKGTLKASSVNGEEVFPYIMNEVSVGKYDIRIGNFFTMRHMLQMQLEYSANGIKIDAVNKSLGVDARIDFIIDTDNDRVLQNSFIVIKGEARYSKKIELVSCEKWKQEAKFDELIKYESNHSKYFMLPWGQYIALECIADESEEELALQHVKVGYVTVMDERNSALFIAYDEVKLSDSRARYRIYNFAADIFEEKIFGRNAQVYFDSLGFNSRGYYKANMADKYFEFEGKRV